MSPVGISTNESILVRLQFGPSIIGKRVVVQAGPGVTTNLPQPTILLPVTAECDVTVTLGEGFLRGAISFSCEGFQTTLPLGRILPAAQSVTAKREGAR
jgi:hypothetical protein